MSMTAYSSYTIVDLVDGIVWKGEMSVAPESPQMSWAYYNTIDKKSYIYTGSEWAVFVRDGESGDYVKYLYQRTNIEEPPTYPGDDPSLWLDEAQGVTEELQYEYVVTITTQSGSTTISTPRLWAKYGRTIVSITEQYAIKNNKADSPTDSDWRVICPDWSEGQFLWTRTKILYSDDSVTYTEPICTTLWEAAVNSITSIAQIQQGADANGGYIQAIVRDMITYNVGDVSPSYGMSYDDAMIAVPLGTVYVPTVAHSENLIPDARVSLKDVGEELFSAGTLEERESSNDVIEIETPPVSALDTTEMQTYEFEVYDDYTYRYEWTGSRWDKGVKVSRSTVYYEYDGTTTTPYLWYCPQDVTNENATNGYGSYKAGTLYAWQDKHWIAISTTTDSLLAQSISLVRQTANSYAVELRDLQGNYSEYKQTVDKISLLVAGADGDVGNLEVTEDGIYGTVKANSASIGLVVENDAVKGSVIIEAINNQSQATISADKVNLNGYVTITSLADNSTTTINGAEICSGVIKSNNYVAGSAGTYIDLSSGAIYSKNFNVDASGNVSVTGTLDANMLKIKGVNVLTTEDKIAADYLELKGLTIRNNSNQVTLQIDSNGNVTLAGSISWSNITNVPSSITGAYTLADDAYTIASNAQTAANRASNTVSGWTYGSTTYIDGTKIATGTVMASSLQGGEVKLLTDEMDIDGNPIQVGGLILTSAETADAAIELYSHQAMRITVDEGSLYLTSGSNFIHIPNNSRFIFVGDEMGRDRESALVPADDGKYDLGAAGTDNYRWRNIYTTNGVINTSDKREKKDVEYDMDKYESFFANLKPTQYKFVNGNSNRYHLGFISQDVEKSLLDNGLKSTDFAGFIKSPIYEDKEETIIKDYSYGLRYGEFIALNTHMIQKLYKRIDELETQLNNISEEKE